MLCLSVCRCVCVCYSRLKGRGHCKPSKCIFQPGGWVISKEYISVKRTRAKRETDRERNRETETDTDQERERERHIQTKRKRRLCKPAAFPCRCRQKLSENRLLQCGAGQRECRRRVWEKERAQGNIESGRAETEKKNIVSIQLKLKLHDCNQTSRTKKTHRQRRVCYLPPLRPSRPMQPCILWLVFLLWPIEVRNCAKYKDDNKHLNCFFFGLSSIPCCCEEIQIQKTTGAVLFTHFTCLRDSWISF